MAGCVRQPKGIERVKSTAPPRSSASQPPPVEALVFTDAASLVRFVRQAERNGIGDQVERLAGAGLALYPDGAIGFMYRSVA